MVNSFDTPRADFERNMLNSLIVSLDVDGNFEISADELQRLVDGDIFKK